MGKKIKKEILTSFLTITMCMSLVPSYSTTIYAKDSVIAKEMTTVISDNLAITGFSTGHCIYFNAPAFIKGGNEIKGGKIVKNSIPAKGGRAIIAGSNDGTIMALRIDGTKIWETKAGNAMIFNVVTYDIDEDGLDEILVPSADGNLYVLDDNGELLWKFKSKDKLYTAAALKDSQGKVCIVTTGVDKYIYKLDANGNLLDKAIYKEQNVITYMQAADLKDDGEETLILVGTSCDNWTTMMYNVDVDHLESPVWKTFFTDIEWPGQPNGGSVIGRNEKYAKDWKEYNEAYEKGEVIKQLKSEGHFSIADVDKDGVKEIIISHQKGTNLCFLTAEGKMYKPFNDENITKGADDLPARGYKRTDIDYVELPGKEPYILTQAEAFTATFKIDPKQKGKGFNDGNAYNGGTFDKETGLYFLNSEMSGGDDIHVIDLHNDKWIEDFKNMPEVGRIVEIKNNLKTLSEQVQNFKKPDYQKDNGVKLNVIGDGPLVMASDYGIQELDKFNMMGFEWNWTEVFDRSHLPEHFIKPGKVHNVKTEDIIAKAKQHEEEGSKFAIWTGHNTDPYYMQLSTLDKILEVAPTTVQLFVFAEMDSEEDKVAVETVLLPLAELIRKHNSPAKIFLRNKFMFWNFEYDTPEWREFINDDYRDLIVPSMEETNCRTHELSLAGRVGLLKTGTVDRWSGRMVEDNASVNKQFEWSMQQTPSTFLRNMVYNMVNGASYFQNRITQIGNRMQYRDIYQLFEKGAIVIPTRDELLSVPDVALSFENVDPVFYNKANNSHGYNTFDEDETTKYVVNDIESWGGYAPLKDYDISKYIYGCTDRTPNFMPITPYGMVASVPSYNSKEGELFKKVLRTDGKSFTIDGKTYDPESAKPVIEKILEESRDRLPFYVEGNAAWSAVKIDDTHTRITLVDSNYMSPQGAKATIVSNTKDAIKCTDILSNEEITINNNKMEVIVPAGIFRIIDVETK